MFKRNVTEGDVSDILTARALLRYNNYAVDPLAKDDPITGSISSRGDLRTPKPVAFGGVVSIQSLTAISCTNSLHVDAFSRSLV